MPRTPREGNGRQRLGTKIKAARRPPFTGPPEASTQDKSGPRAASIATCAGTVPHPASVQVPAGGALRVLAPVTAATGARMGLGARALEVGVLDTVALGLVAGHVDEFVGVLGLGQHDGLWGDGLRRAQLPLSLLLVWFAAGRSGRLACGLRNGQAWPDRRRLCCSSVAPGLSAWAPGRPLMRIAFGSLASWIMGIAPGRDGTPPRVQQ